MEQAKEARSLEVIQPIYNQVAAELGDTMALMGYLQKKIEVLQANAVNLRIEAEVSAHKKQSDATAPAAPVA